MVKLVFLDGDGTVWYPRNTEGRQVPWWVYKDPAIADPIKELIVTPNTIETLRRLGELGIRHVLLSTSPLPEQEAIAHRTEVARHVGILGLLDDIRVAPNVPEGKSRQIQAILDQYQVKPEEAVMIGDIYEWDIVAARAVSVTGVLIARDYENNDANVIGMTPIINDLSEILPLLGLDS